ncbi:Ig-like domain-containing protein, partial [Intestinimonas sp.]|uniref:Ig-like domain-containing protein n=2 Tax=Intestinimonas TaxID=1392389 RepID=UPI00261A5112
MLANTRKRAMALLLTFAMVLGMLPVGVLAAEGEDLTPVERGNLEVTAGSSVTISDAAEGDTASDQETWSSDDEAVATVDENGTVTGVAAGETVIHHTYFEAVEVPVAPAPPMKAPVESTPVESTPVPEAEGGESTPAPETEGGESTPAPETEGGESTPAPETEGGESTPA